MKLSSLSTALLLVSTACGTVTDPTQLPPDEMPPVAIEQTPDLANENTPTPPPPPPPPPVLLIEAPHASTSPGSLATMTFAANSPISELLRTDGQTRIDVLEQRIVTKTSEEIQLTVELPAPTGTFSRTIVSDIVRHQYQVAEHVLCKRNGLNIPDARCGRTAPVSSVAPASGAIGMAQWKLWVVDDVTGTPLTSCIAQTPTKLDCVLSGQAGVAYRIVASATGFVDLWNGEPGVIDASLPEGSFTGTVATRPESFCTDWSYTTTSEYCETRWQYTRFTAVDTASLELDPITVEISANEQRSALATPALAWDAGNDDLPGSY